MVTPPHVAKGQDGPQYYWVIKSIGEIGSPAITTIKPFKDVNQAEVILRSTKKSDNREESFIYPGLIGEAELRQRLIQEYNLAEEDIQIVDGTTKSITDGSILGIAY